MAKNFLDKAGLTYLWGKLKAIFVPQTRKINNKALSSDITLTASDVGAAASSHTHSDYATKTELSDAVTTLEETISGLNLGFVESESEMQGNASSSGSSSSGGQSKIKFYPEVISLDDYESLTQGQTIILNESMDDGACVILQPTNGMRSLAQCLSCEEESGEYTITNTTSQYNSALPEIGYVIEKWSEVLGDVGDFIAVRYYTGENATVGWVLTTLTGFGATTACHYLEVLGILPTDYDGALGTITLVNSRSTLEVLTLLDTKSTQLYNHKIYVVDADQTMEGTAVFSFNFATPLTNDNISSMFDMPSDMYAYYAYGSSSTTNITAFSAVLHNYPSYMSGVHIAFTGVNGSITFRLSDGCTITDTVTPA